MAPPTVAEPRRRMLRVLLTDAEWDDVVSWAEQTGQPMSAVVRGALWPHRSAPGTISWVVPVTSSAAR